MGALGGWDGLGWELSYLEVGWSALHLSTFFSFLIGMGENEMIIDLCLFSLCDMKFI